MSFEIFIMSWQSCVSLSCPVVQVVQRIKAVDNETRLLVVDHETHESLRSLRLTATEEMAILGAGPQCSSTPPASPSPAPSSVPSSPGKKQENGSVSKQPAALSSQVQKPTRRSPSKAAKKVTRVCSDQFRTSYLLLWTFYSNYGISKNLSVDLD